MDAIGTTLFTGGVVLALGSFFTQVYEFVKGRRYEKTQKCSSKNNVDKCLGASPIQIVLGGAVF